MKRNLLKLSCYALLLAFTSCSSCKKEINALPDATQTGTNTFGCLIDGKAWVPKGGATVPRTRPIIGGYRKALAVQDSLVQLAPQIDAQATCASALLAIPSILPASSRAKNTFFYIF